MGLGRAGRLVESLDKLLFPHWICVRPSAGLAALFRHFHPIYKRCVRPTPQQTPRESNWFYDFIASLNSNIST